MSGMRVALLLTAVVGLGALSIDMFLPSRPRPPPSSSP
jgi:hypothetical protein